jgi:hypothetical protein
MSRKINVKDTEVAIVTVNDLDYISLTDIAKYKTDDPSAVIGNWMRNRNTIEFLGIWETLYNQYFKPLEFEGFRKEAGLNAFTMSPQKWINATNAIKKNLIPKELTSSQISVVYATEADVLNVALFGMTAKQWKEANPDLTGNMRDHALINELICLSNLENLNALFIAEGMSQTERLIKLNKIAIEQMTILLEAENRNLLK